MNNILEVTGLKKVYKDFNLSDISFSLQEDCITGFIGVNGAGKTTTLRAILNLISKESGLIKFFGKDMQTNKKELKNRIGIVLDDGCFYDELSMSEMKSIIAPAYSTWSEQDYKAYMERFNLNSYQKISALSRGMRMKFALALALSHNADLLIMDEPTSGLDPLIRSQLMEILTDYMNQGGKSVFFSTHVTSDLDKIADMLILIDNGKILFEEEKDTLIDNHRLVKGDKKYLNEETRKLFLNIQESSFGFTGLTKQLDLVQKSMSNILVERPSIEDIMLGYIEGGKSQC
ncbi:ABC transporter ATP-binding protein [Clostridium botulinum]|uniref:ABC transporter ATP-binding protein n=1 Tax=Clostridium botulinum TaxID=1491 RepID=A0A846J919_CLOBO|nr:ABC transporter ATP-binding protein [Clostridium botulinum]ACA56074.1 ABC transporter, ATP-binding protein [Clostridium botulinum A3 str. Loch Maree]NFH64723.1 ABC transporter ATP-binding protein [Clostridium botulinum]NFJ08537.1 ABC transporter ATP-binding protein [Clostridium botulinum]NFK14933.1 ABC transporter ATP-binding protein [Clostridium botulinum]NFM92971.1 ABC transporter ATP-binding protein [Clostridium botulinum]